jgi:hypothetical protein
MSYYLGSNGNTYERLHSPMVVLGKLPERYVIVLAVKCTLVGKV